MAQKGLLTIEDVIRLDQFWAKGKSDGDTGKITIPKGVTSSFKFAASPTAKAKVVHKFDTAISSDVSKKALTKNDIKFATKVVTQPRGKANVGVRQITIRMQWIDTPELHYKIYDDRTIVPIPKANGTVTINRISHFEIDDSFDPMMPITQAKSDLRFLSVRAADGDVGVYLRDFADDNPVSRKFEMNMDGAPLSLHSSWALRPLLVIETKEPTPKTKLVFSRGRVLAGSDQRVDTARIEALVLERNAADPQETPFSASAEAACTVKYRFESVDSARPCGRTFDRARAMRPSPAAMISASQLLVGRFARTSGLALAFTDRCLSQHPIVLAPSDGERLDVNVNDRTEQALH